MEADQVSNQIDATGDSHSDFHDGNAAGGDGFSGEVGVFLVGDANARDDADFLDERADFGSGFGHGWSPCVARTRRVNRESPQTASSSALGRLSPGRANQTESVGR